jgi:hypothetical protein
VPALRVWSGVLIVDNSCALTTKDIVDLAVIAAENARLIGGLG